MKKPTATVAPPVDRRIRRTQHGLREALLNLIVERGWDAVTVRDVCERADVGRSTFYVHFADKESLLLSGFDDLQEAVSAYGHNGSQPFAFAEPLITHALENEHIFRAVVGRQSAQQIQWRFRDMLVALLGKELAVMKLPEKSRGSTARFLAGGFIEHLMDALDAPKAPRPEVLAARFSRLALGVVEAARDPRP